MYLCGGFHYSERYGKFPKTGAAVLIFEFDPEKFVWYKPYKSLASDDAQDVYFRNADDRDRYLSEKLETETSDGEWFKIDTLDIDTKTLVPGIRFVPERLSRGISVLTLETLIRKRFSKYDAGKPASVLKSYHTEGGGGGGGPSDFIQKPGVFEGFRYGRDGMEFELRVDSPCGALETTSLRVTYRRYAEILNRSQEQLSFFQ